MWHSFPVHNRIQLSCLRWFAAKFALLYREYRAWALSLLSRRLNGALAVCPHLWSIMQGASCIIGKLLKHWTVFNSLKTSHWVYSGWSLWEMCVTAKSNRLQRVNDTDMTRANFPMSILYPVRIQNKSSFLCHIFRSDPIINRCVPKDLFTIAKEYIENIISFLNASELLSKALVDLYMARWIILALCGISMGKHESFAACKPLEITLQFVTCGTERVSIEEGCGLLGGSPPPPPPTPWPLFCSACLSERLVMYEDLPTPCLENWHNFFFFGRKKRSPPPHTLSPPFSGLAQHYGLHPIVKHLPWINH